MQEHRTTCAHCGAILPIQDLSKGGRRRLYCGSQCAQLARIPRYECQQCGISFQPKTHTRTTFCSRECGYAYKRVHGSYDPRPAFKVEYEPCPCVECGLMFTPKERRHRFCSEHCCDQHHGRLPLTEQTNTCRHCGKAFVVTAAGGTKKHGDRAYCSMRCMNTANTQQRRARRRGAFVAPVSLAYIYQRDGGLCQLCGKRVALSLDAKHQRSATIDHIIPLALGGTHEPKNVQLAHLICNSRKSWTGAGQTRMF